MGGFSNKSQIIHTKVDNALASDISISASYSAIASNSDSASYALSSSYSLSGSYALTASYAMNGGGGGSTQSLQQVVNTGNSIVNFGGVGTASLQSVNFVNNRALYINNDIYPTIRIVDNTNASNNLQIDIDTISLDGVSYNWSDIVNNVDTSSFATTGSNIFIGNQTISGSINFGDGSVIQSISASSGDGGGYTTLTLKPNTSVISDQYIVLDPTTPNHIHIRAGGIIDSSSAYLYLGGEKSNIVVRNLDNSFNEKYWVQINSQTGSTQNTWTFDDNGDLIVPGNVTGAGNLVTTGSNIFIGNQTISGSLYQSGTFYPDIIDWFSSSIQMGTGSYILTTDNNGVTQYDSYTNVASALSPYISINTSSFATTGSNTFNNNQTISGSLIITQDLTVLGSSSITYISQSTLNISTNLITVNTNTPGIRFGGLAVIDSGSSPQRSGSILFDSQNNQWIFVHQNVGDNITSSVFIQGPQTFNNVGNETTLTINKVPKATGGDLGEHIGDSNITDTGTVIHLGSATQVTGSLNVSGGITGSLLGTASLSTQAINARTPSTAVLPTLGSTIKAEPLWGGWQEYPGSSYVLVNQRCILQPVYLYEPTTLTGVKWIQITQGNYTGNNYNGIGLYTYSAGTLTCVASSSNNANLWSTFANGTMGSASFSFGANYNAAAGLYYIAAVWNQTGAITTNPVIGQGLTTTTTTFTFDFTNSAKGTSRTSAAVTTALPTSVAMSNITALQNVFYLTLY
jgi:hypothetical protein